jgi:hypothetical protein
VFIVAAKLFQHFRGGKARALVQRPIQERGDPVVFGKFENLRPVVAVSGMGRFREFLLSERAAVHQERKLRVGCGISRHILTT